MHFSKAFDTSNHELLVAKLNAYGSGNEALQLAFSYFNNRKQRVKITEKTIMWYTTSVLGPIIFNIYSNNLFLFLNKIDVCTIADDSTSFVSEKNFAELLEKLERDSELAIYWF